MGKGINGIAFMVYFWVECPEGEFFTECRHDPFRSSFIVSVYHRVLAGFCLANLPHDFKGLGRHEAALRTPKVSEVLYGLDRARMREWPHLSTVTV